MPNIIPYRAFTYSQKLRSSVGDLVSPPYDVISPEGFEKLKGRHPFNSVRLCLAENANDTERYEKMKTLFTSWKKEGVFETHPTASFYLVEETFKMGGAEKKRSGFVALMEVSPFAEKKVLPHEHTLSGPKQDRLDLLKAMGAELSQIFLCYRDKKFILEGILEKSAARTPLVQGTDSQNISRRVWAIEDPAQIAKLQELIASQAVLIADGHHRYETAVHFRNMDGTSRSKYVQCYFTNLDTPGFEILPIHRLFSLPENMPAEKFVGELKKYFNVQDFGKCLDLPTLMHEKKDGDLKLICSFNESGQNLLLTQKKKTADGAEIFSIQNDIFEKILEWDISKVAKGVIRYEHETEDFKKTLKSLPRGVGLFLPPTDLGLVMGRALRGERMPQKSTFFYPKIASGLINYELGMI